MTEKFDFFGFDCDKFEYDGTFAFVAKPSVTPNNKIAFKTEYWCAFPELEFELLKRGFHVIHLKTKTRLANKADCERKKNFVDYVTEKYNLEKKCVLVGMSCGGAQAINFTALYPEYVSCMVIDAPVINFLDFPGRYDKYEDIWEKEFTVAYPGVKRNDVFKLEFNPVNKIPEVIKHKIPVIMLYGTEDTTVFYDINGRYLVEAYEGNRDLLTVIKRECQGHHPHGLLGKSDELADLVMTKIK